MKANSNRRSTRAIRRGVAAVEFAIVLPLLLLLVLGIWDLGQIVRGLQIVSIAAREGGRQASTGSRSLDQIEQMVRSTLTQNGLPGADAVFTYVNATSGKEPKKADQSDTLNVTVSIPFSSLRLVNGLLGPFRVAAETLSVTSQWQSMRDIPITVPTTIPSG